jgi:hypothetical protein
LGLSCADVPQRDSATANSGHHAQSSLLALITVLSVVVALFHWTITPFIFPKDGVLHWWGLSCTFWCSLWASRFFLLCVKSL